MTPDPLADLLQRYWGYTSFRPLQREAMEAVVAGRDSLLVLPTGGGKSLCFQAPALVRDGLALVVSPLISLMKDQVDTLVDNGVSAALYNSTLSSDQKASVSAGIREGRYRLLYVAPERLVGDGGDGFLSLISSRQVSFVAIDEAHCISQWGHDFRPEYRQLRQLRQRLPAVSLHAYTATATARVRRDIVSELGLTNALELVGSFDRPNLVYRVVPRGTLKKQLEEILERHRGEAGIVYCPSRKEVDGIAEWLVRRAVIARARTMPVWTMGCGIATRMRFSTRTSTSSWPRSRSAWASTDRTSASSSTPARRSRSSTISRSRGARAATGSTRSACSCTRRRTF